MILKSEEVTKNSIFYENIKSLAKEAFPPEEYLSPDELVKMSEAENFDFYSLSDEGKFVGFMVAQTFKNLCYLFFLAIDSSCRGKGYGSLAIKTLKSLYPEKTQVVDFEMIDESSSNNEQRKKRKSFYLKNGYKETGLFLSYLGVDYEVMCDNDSKFDEEEFKQMLESLKIDGFKPKYFIGR